LCSVFVRCAPPYPIAGPPHAKRAQGVGRAMDRDGLWLESMLEAAEPQCRAERVRHRADTIFLLVMGSRIIAMQTGFAMLEAAYGRPMNSANIMMKNSMDLFLGVFVYYFFGYWISFGKDPMIIEENAFDFALWFLHFSYATTAATINSGALAGRVSFLAYLILSLLLTGVIYPVGVQWVWGGGWLSELGYVDFAGSSLVHMVGAISALVAVSVCGPRVGKYPDYRCWRGIWRYVFSERNDSAWYQLPEAEVEKAVFTPIKACNNPVQLLFGTFLLLVGFLAFNPASTMATTFNTDLVSARTTVTTLIAAAAGAVSGIVWSMAARRGLKLRVPELTNSVLGGLVASCACCHVVPPVFMMLVGFVGGLLATATAVAMEYCQLDDTVGAVSVHGPPAIWGVLSVALFAQPHCQSDLRGLIFGGGDEAWKLLLTQITGILSLGAFAAMATYISVITIDLAIGFRCNRAHELIGLDFTEHGIDDGSLKYEKKEHLLTHSPVRDCLVERVKSVVTQTPSKMYTENGEEGADRGADSIAQHPSDDSSDVALDAPISLQREVAELRENVLQLTKTLSHLVNSVRGDAETSMGLNIIGAAVDGRYHGHNREHALQELMQEAEATAVLGAARAVR